jgi:WD40 repeat protein
MYLFSDLLQSSSHKFVPLIKFQQKEKWLPIFSYDTKWLATMDSNFLVSVWDIQNRKPIMSLQHASWVKADFSLDGLQFITGGCYDGIRVWKTENWEPIIIPPNEHDLCLYDYSIDSAGRNILSTYSDGNVRLTNIATNETSVISYHKLIDPFFSIKASFSPSGNRLVTSGDDGIVRIIDTDSKQMTDIIFAGDMIRDVLFSPDGKYIIAATQNKEIYIWESETNHLRDKACSILSRNLTQDEWSRFMGNNIPYQKTCENLPPGQ